jgi:hypothetical protein
MMGVVVEVVLQARKRIAVTSRAFCVPTKSGEKAAAKLTKQRAGCDALFAIIVPDRAYTYMETRKKVRCVCVARGRAAVWRLRHGGAVSPPRGGA